MKDDASSKAETAAVARRGKIARLPLDIRRQLNQRLQNGGKAAPLLNWLNHLPPVKAVLAAEFHAAKVTKQNLSEWRKGGYRDWEAQQNALAEVQTLIEGTDSIDQDLRDSLTERMGVFLALRMAAELQRLDAAGNSAEKSKALAEWHARLARLRRAESVAARVALDRERLELERKKNQENFEEECWKWAAQEHIRAEICRGFCYTAEEKRAAMREIYGMNPIHGQENGTPAHPGESKLVQVNPS